MISTTRALPSPSFMLFDLHRSVHTSPCVTPRFADREIQSLPLDLPNEIYGYELITCV